MVSKLFGFIFGGIGLVLLVMALGFAFSTGLAIGSSSAANGVVIDGGDTGGGRKVTALIEFTSQAGQVVRFRSAIASNPAEFQTGQQVKVYYKPSDPAGSAMVDSVIQLWFWSLLFGFLALVFGTIGLVSLVIWFTGERKKKWLEQHGQRIQARITEVKKNTRVHNLGKSPYYVVARASETRNSLSPVFRSNSVWNLPATATPGSDINVLVDPNNYNRYYVELADAKPDAKR